MEIKNLNITASESPIAVSITPDTKYVAIRNDGDSDILVSSIVTEPTETADGVMKIPSSTSGIIPVVNNTVYISSAEDSVCTIASQDDKVFPWGGSGGGSGGGGGTVVEETLGIEDVVLWTNDGTTNPDTITLSESWQNFDELIIEATYVGTSDTYRYVNRWRATNDLLGLRLQLTDEANYCSYILSTATTLTNNSAKGNIIFTSIIGRRYTRANPTGYRETVLWENEGATNPNTITLSEAYTGFDALAIKLQYKQSGQLVDDTTNRIIPTSGLIVGWNELLFAVSGTAINYIITSPTLFTANGISGDYVLVKITGCKY